ncbi:MAG: alpha-amylase family glycosyl hydrolase [Planctomycetota bacterium]|jgi:1,4-alpha-glucan branching enzyme
MCNETIGARLVDGGCRFRVWAPHAEQIRVLIQSGTGWRRGDPTRMVALNPDRERRFWSAIVDNVKAGDLYRYEITYQRSAREKLDAASRDVLHSGLTRYQPDNENASVVLGSQPYSWSPFQTPRFENFIIYQLHIGSFAGRNDHFNVPIATFRDVESKFTYIRSLGFNAVQPLPVHEFSQDRSWGYNPASFFAPESAYGSPQDLKHFVDTAHQHGLAVIFDVVYNHAGPADNVLWNYDGYSGDGGIYFEGGQMTWWGRGPAWQKREVQDFFFQNAQMFLEDYNADGLRFDVTTQINGNYLREVLWRLKQEFPGKYLIAEHLPAHPWITTAGNFDATWFARAHHECQRALAGQDPVGKIKSILGWDGFQHPWQLVKYTAGSHDDIGDTECGDAEHGLSNWDSRHRYLVDQLGGRESWHARAKCRLAWALNVSIPGTSLMFMGSECLMASPHVAWGYWHDGEDPRGDHRFNWAAAGDPVGIQMRWLVAAANAVRWENPALRSDTLITTHEDYDNNVLAFKRWADGNLVLVVLNLGEANFHGHSYGVRTGWQFGQWTQILCTQDAAFGGWDGAGNAFYEPWTQPDGMIYVNLPKWSAMVFRLK